MNRACFLLIGAVCHSALAGDIDPPAGAPDPTMKTLEQVEPRTLIGPVTTPGTGVSVYTITEPGSYYLDADVIAIGATHGIGVLADDVTIDLMGFAIRGIGAENYAGVTCAPTSERVTTRNGVITGFAVGFNAGCDSVASDLLITECEYGIYFFSFGIARNCVVEDIITYGFAGEQAIFESCTAKDSGSYGFFTFGRAIIRNCAAVAGGGGFRTGLNSVVTDCSSIGHTGVGFESFSGSFIRCSSIGGVVGIETEEASLVQDCNIQDAVESGVRVGPGSQVVGCVLDGNGAEGILAADSCAIRNNVLYQNGLGIVTGSNCLISGNTSTSHSFGVGVLAEDHCRVTDNVCNQNAFGISVRDSGTVERNTTAWNLSGGIDFRNSCRVSNNVAENNSLSGSNGFESFGEESLVESNLLSNNGRDGLVLHGKWNLVIRNVFRLNSQHLDLAADNRVGFTVIPPLSGPISGNSDPDALGAGTTDPWANIEH